MISWHKVGQKVVCVDDWSWAPPQWPRRLRDCGIRPCIEENGIYEISEVVVDEVQAYFRLVEFSHAPGRWPAKRFQPVYPQAIDKLRELLNPTPEQKRPVLEEIIMERVAGLPT